MLSISQTLKKEGSRHGRPVPTSVRFRLLSHFSELKRGSELLRRYAPRSIKQVVINSVVSGVGEEVSQACVSDDDDLSHDGGYGDDWLFAVCDEALVDLL